MAEAEAEAEAEARSVPMDDEVIDRGVHGYPRTSTCWSRTSGTHPRTRPAGLVLGWSVETESRLALVSDSDQSIIIYLLVIWDSETGGRVYQTLTEAEVKPRPRSGQPD